LPSPPRLRSIAPIAQAIARRLIPGYTRTTTDEVAARLPAPQDDLWTGLLNAELSDRLQGILDSRDAPALAHYLLHFGEDYTWFGGLSLSVDGYTHPGRCLSRGGLLPGHKLVCLAESLGVLALENPEQSRNWGRQTCSSTRASS